MQDAKPEFDAAGAGLVLIGQAALRDAADFREKFAIKLTVLADERRDSYRAAGAKMAGLMGLFGPRVVLTAFQTVLGDRVVQGKTIGHPAQLGATLVIGPGGLTRLRHIARDASDNATPREILAAVATAHA